MGTTTCGRSSYLSSFKLVVILYIAVLLYRVHYLTCAIGNEHESLQNQNTEHYVYNGAALREIFSNTFSITLQP